MIFVWIMLVNRCCSALIPLQIYNIKKAKSSKSSIIFRKVQFFMLVWAFYGENMADILCFVIKNPPI